MCFHCKVNVYRYRVTNEFALIFLRLYYWLLCGNEKGILRTHKALRCQKGTLKKFLTSYHSFRIRYCLMYVGVGNLRAQGVSKRSAHFYEHLEPKRAYSSFQIILLKLCICLVFGIGCKARRLKRKKKSTRVGLVP